MLDALRKAASLLIVAFVLGVVLPSTSSGTGGPSTIAPASDPTFLPVKGLRPTGATLASSATSADTNLVLTDASRLKPGQLIEISVEIMQLVSVVADGDPATTDSVQVVRGQAGTSPVALAAGAPIFADASRVALNAAGVGVALTTDLDSGTEEATPAILSAPITSTDTTGIKVSDASVLLGSDIFAFTASPPIQASFDGMSFVSVANASTFLGSTGRKAQCSHSPTGSYVLVQCHTLDATPDTGPSGAGTLATVTLSTPKAAAIVNLTLSDVELVEVTVCNAVPGSPGPCDPPIDEGEVIPGVAVIGSPPPLAPTTPPNPTTGSPSVYVSPNVVSGVPGGQITVDVKVDEIPAPGPSTGHGLGGYQFKLSWDLVIEDVAITWGRPGFLNDAGQPWDRGVTLSSAVGSAETLLPVVNGTALQPGWTARIDTEQVLITAASASQIEVLRAYRGTAPTSHPAGTPVYAGPERVNLTRATPAFDHPAGAALIARMRVLQLTDHQPLQSAASFMIGTEEFIPVEVPAQTLASCPATLATGISAMQTTILLNGSLAAGDVAKVDVEFMAILSMSGSQATVQRGWWNSQAAPHADGSVLCKFSPQAGAVRAIRAVNGTTAASHASGAPVLGTVGLGSYQLSLDGPADGSVALRAITNGPFLGVFGRMASCTETMSATAASIACTSSGSASGAAGAGQLASVDISGVMLEPGAPTKTVTLAGSLTDLNGNGIGVKVSSVSLKVVRCPDVDGNRVANFAGDVITIAKASFRIVPQNPALQDIDNNGAINFAGDAITAAKVVLLGQPVGLRCPPPQ